MGQTTVVIGKQVFPSDMIDIHEDGLQVSQLSNGRVGVKLSDASPYRLALIRLNDSAVKITLVQK